MGGNLILIGHSFDIFDGTSISLDKFSAHVKGLFSLVGFISVLLLDLHFSLGCNLLNNFSSVFLFLFFFFDSFYFLFQIASVQELIRDIVPTDETFLLERFDVFFRDGISSEWW
jgi:hypothetical protein